MGKLGVVGVAALSAPSEYRFGLFSETFLERISYNWLQNNKEEFMSITAEFWQANLIALVSAFLAIKVTCAEFKYDHL